MRVSLISVFVPALLLGCGGATPRGTDSAGLDEVRIAARQTENGYHFERQRPRALFYQALQQAELGAHDEAALAFERLAEQFPGSRFAPSALYNAAVCLSRSGDHARAATQLERLIRVAPTSPGSVRARLELAAVHERLSRWDKANAQLTAVLGQEGLRPSLRLEAMVQRAKLVLSMGQLDQADVLAAEALAYGRAFEDSAATRRSDEAELATVLALRSEAAFVEAETFRLRAAAVSLTRGGDSPRAERLARRGQLMLEAQRLYFETLRGGDPHWVEQAGLRLGALYRDLWNELPGPVGLPPVVGRAVTAENDTAATVTEVETLVRRGLQQAEVALRLLERVDRVPVGFADRVRAELQDARAGRPSGPEAANGLGQAPQDL